MMVALVKELGSHAELLKLSRESKNLILLIFSADWCGACKIAEKWFEEVAAKFKDSVTLVLLKQDKMQESFIIHNVNSMPTFLLMKMSKELNRVAGNSKQKVIDMITASLESETVSGDHRSSSDSIGNGRFTNIIEYVDRTRSYCLGVANDKDWLQILDSHFEQSLDPPDDLTFFLQSDVDAQMILTFEFPNTVQLHGFYMCGPKENGPKDVRIFVNESRQLDFSYCEETSAVQTFMLKKHDYVAPLAKETLKELPFYKLKPSQFRSVSNISFFINSNQSNDPDATTFLSVLKIYGCLVDYSGVTMQNFKRVAGSANTPHM
ncbi:hypothetical protein GJ496_008786 [Pomphorhynchus laevis]|nr:hypothetical protein GJ496_008786 [Pomphorhynchus laevis]